MRLNNIKGNNFGILRKDNTAPPVYDWEEISDSLASNNNRQNIKFINDKFFILGSGGLISFSENGDSFTSKSIPQSVISYNIIYDGTRYVMCHNGSYISYTNDLNSTWTVLRISTTETNIVQQGIAYSPTLNMYVTVGSLFGNSKIYTSNNLTSWTARTSPFGTSDITNVLWHNDRFIAVGYNGKIAYSTNGITWSLVSNMPSLPSNTFIKLKLLNNELYALHGSGMIKSSDGGNSWSTVPYTIGTLGGNLSGISYNPMKKVFVLGSSQGNLATTKDFISYNIQIIQNDTGNTDIEYGNNTLIAKVGSIGAKTVRYVE